ncbi:MAG TPA: hypothetical protein PKM88_05390, partial [bacterium]|nr:hypothetical protein [bacterium]
MTDTLATMRMLQEMFGGTVTLLEDESLMPASARPAVLTNEQYFAAAARFAAALRDWHACQCFAIDPEEATRREQVAVAARREFHTQVEAGRAAGAHFVMDDYAEEHGLSELELETVLYLHCREQENRSARPRAYAAAELVAVMTPGYTGEQRRQLVSIARSAGALLAGGLLQADGDEENMLR